MQRLVQLERPLFDGGAPVVSHTPLRKLRQASGESHRFAPRLARFDEANTDVLLDNVVALEFSYYGARDRGADAEWTDRWDDKQRLPLLVRVKIVFPESDRRVWPELIVALKIQGEFAATESRAPAQ